MDKLSIGDRMKLNYENRTRYYLPRRSYFIIRLDGVAFHSFTRHCCKPFDTNLMYILDEVAKYLCSEVQGTRFSFQQSDEISILMSDFDNIQTDMWFDGNIQKIVSVSAGKAAAFFNNLYGSNNLACFDARVFTIPDLVEVSNYFIWRQQDWTRNSVCMLANKYYSHGQLDGKNNQDMHEMIFQAGDNWNNYSDDIKRGRMIVRRNGKWIKETPPIFTQYQDYLYSMIPELPRFEKKSVIAT